MKIILQIALSCSILVSFTTKAQIPGEQRGLYVNRFITLVTSGANADEIDISNSILTNSTEENKLLTYCMQNHITYISLYGLRNIFLGNPQQINDKILALREFICM